MAKYIGWNRTTKRKAEVNGLSVSAGVADANKIVETNGAGVIDITLLPTGIANVSTFPASEALLAGAYVNIYDSGAGVMKVRNADASTYAKKAHGFVLAAVANAATATVYFEGQNTSLSALVAADYYLSDLVPGAALPDTGVLPTTAGHIIQKLGVGIGATTIETDIDDEPFELG